MITAIDTNVLIDILMNDPEWAHKSLTAVEQVSSQGKLIICEVVLAELKPGLPGDLLNGFLSDFGIHFIANDRESAALAGEMFAKYLKHRDKETAQERKRVVPDFLIGAHAKVHASRLLTRDRGFYKRYFQDLSISGA